MNLSEELRGLARSLKDDWEFPVVLHEAADIIDSLLKADDGSPIWVGCWAVVCEEDNSNEQPVGPVPPRAVFVGRVTVMKCCDRKYTIESVEVEQDDQEDGRFETINEYTDFWIASTHRTKAEAEAAAKRMTEVAK